jgi:hypothetical protein
MPVVERRGVRALQVLIISITDSQHFVMSPAPEKEAASVMEAANLDRLLLYHITCTDEIFSVLCHTGLVKILSLN